MLSNILFPYNLIESTKSYKSFSKMLLQIYFTFTKLFHKAINLKMAL